MVSRRQEKVKRAEGGETVLARRQPENDSTVITWHLAGEDYLRLKGYPEARSLSGAAQDRLSWEDRAAEWFAEDFRALYSPVKYVFDLTHRAGPEVTDEVRAWFARLLQSNPERS